MTRHIPDHFYSHIVSIDTIIVELENLDMSSEEREELLLILDSHRHLTIIDVILTHLSENDKKQFLQYVEENDHENVWKLLQEKIEHSEEKIKEAAEKLKEELLHDIHEAREE